MHHCTVRVSSVILLAFAALLPLSLHAQNQNPEDTVLSSADPNAASQPGESTKHQPREDRLRRGHAFHGDLRTLPQARPQKFERPEFEEPDLNPVMHPGTPA